MSNHFFSTRRVGFRHSKACIRSIAIFRIYQICIWRFAWEDATSYYSEPVNTEGCRWKVSFIEKLFKLFLSRSRNNEMSPLCSAIRTLAPCIQVQYFFYSNIGRAVERPLFDKLLVFMISALWADFTLIRIVDISYDIKFSNINIQ